MNVQAEYRQGDGNSKINIKGHDIPVQKVFDAIRKQSGLYVMYNVGVVGVRKEDKVTVNFKDTRLDDVLSFIFNVSKYEWVYNDNAVVVRAKEVKKNDGDSSITKTSITGKVTDAEGKPLPGATVIVKGTKHGASTDAEGNFSLGDVRVNSVLVISSIGFEPREVAVKGKTILAQLNVDVNDLDEAVVIAYNTTTQRTNTGAVTVVKGKDIETLPNRSFDRSLQGQVPGLLVTSGNGQPGGGMSNFVLRGIGTGTQATFGSSIRHPLVVVDGMPISTDIFVRTGDLEATSVTNPLAQLNTNDIETISVLKDAAAIALYGSRAANGVILITTKKGRPGKTTVSFRHQTDIASKINGKVGVLSQNEYLELLYEGYRNQYPGMTDAAIRSDLITKFPTIVRTPGDTAFYPAPNWFDELFTSSATTISNEVSLSGGNEKNLYYFNLGYLTQNGVVKNTGYDRGSLRYNFESRINDWLKLGINSAVSFNKQRFASTGEGYDLIGFPYAISPLNPINLSDGTYEYNYGYGITGYSEYPLPNPAAALKYNINRVTSYRGIGNLFAEINFLKHFKVSTSIGGEFMLSQLKQKIDPRLSIDFSPPGIGRISDEDRTRTGYNLTNTLRYTNTFADKHNVSALLAQEAREYSERLLQASGTELDLPYYEELFNSSNRGGNGNTFKETMLSYFAQANYAYDSRYLVSLSGRKDGASKFGSKEPYRTYWSIGAGWVISEEDFLKSQWLNYLKIRGSIGTSGNSTVINANTRYNTLGLSSYNGSPAAFVNSLGNVEVEPERPFNSDLGLEARLINERVSITMDLYERKISKLLYYTAYPNTYGVEGSLLRNIGNIKNKGIEILISANVIDKPTFKWFISINWSTNSNKLTKANPSLTASGNLVNKENENFNSFYLVRWAGVDPVDGTPQWLDSTGKLTKNYSRSDRVIVGKPQPDGFGGITNTFSYRNFEASFFLYYQYGYQIYDYVSRMLNSDGNSSPYINQSREALNRWRKPGDHAANPRKVLNNTDGGANPSTRYLFNGDFIRLKNVSVSYIFSPRILKSLRLTSLKVFVQGNNLAIWSKFPGIDPENAGVTGSSSFAYPQQRTFSFGFNVSL